MFRSRLSRTTIAAVAAASAIGGFAAIGSAGAASAAPGAALSVKCTSITGNSSTTVQLLGCSGNTGGSSKALLVSTLASGGVIKWHNRLKTTIGTPTLGTGILCPAGDTDVTSTAKVTADTTHSVTVGSTSKIEVCVDGSGNITLAPGTKAKI
jgi:hypothetical protein